MKRLTLSLIFALSACSVPQDEKVLLEAPVMEMPVEDAPMAAPVVIPCDITADDGIGGTGCR